MWWLYNILLTIGSPVWVPWMLLRANRRSEKPNWKERGGDYSFYADREHKRVWVHAVSVGEVVAALPILRELRRIAPDLKIVLSVTTSSGHQTAREKAEGLFDELVYFPIDVPRFQLAAMTRVRPKAVAIMETELWMNFLWAAKAMGATTMVVNGRISDRSYPRSRRIRFFYKALFKYLDQALMQTPVDGERVASLGAKVVEVLGNCKFDQAVEGLDADPAAVRADLGIAPDAPVVVVGSTRGEMEERFVLDALADPRLADVTVVHAPRHLERVPELAEEVKRRFGSVARRSEKETGRYLLLDTYGELSRVYAAADVVVIGGGFDNLGGQNLIQPLAHGKPVLHGPHMQNFQEATDMAARAGATACCDTPAALADSLVGLMHDAERRAKMGSAARQMVASNLGASRRYAEAIACAAGC